MRERIDQIGHAPDDPFIRAAGKTLGFVSDPTNIVPLGMAARQIFNIARIGIPGVLRAIGSGEAANVLKTQVGRIALDSLKTGAVASAKTAASESLTKPWREEWGEEVPWSQIGIDSLMAGFTGFGLGMMGGFGSRITRAPAGGASGGGSAALPPRKPMSETGSVSPSTVDRPPNTDTKSSIAEPPKLSKAEQMRENARAGKAFEQLMAKEFAKSERPVGPQITVKPPVGPKVRLDFLIGEPAKEGFRCADCKSSPTAPLTPNQRESYLEIEKSGGVIRGKGKPGFPGGMKIPPTKVEIITPK